MLKIKLARSFLVLCLLPPIYVCSNTLDQASNGALLTEKFSTVFIANYRDFGPPQLSSPLLGNQWWQWPDPENHKPVTYDIKVVVYRDVSLDIVKESFPVIPEKKQDYRYVAYEDAVTYFDETIQQLLTDMKESVMQKALR